MSTTPTPSEYYATGKRKTAIARVHMRPGSGDIKLNDQGIEDYFGGHEALKLVVKQAFVVTETVEKFDVLAVVSGGGVAAQANRPLAAMPVPAANIPRRKLLRVMEKSCLSNMVSLC